METGYSLERYDSVEEARNSDCDAVIVTDKDKIDNEETSILYYNEPVVEGFDMISFDLPKTKCRIKDDRCVRKQIAKRRKETRILKHIGKMNTFYGISFAIYFILITLVLTTFIYGLKGINISFGSG